ncbi:MULTISPECIES: hypothetical protein [unclassified Enterococcus]|uniref:hypothetical protein n=1 Tax=unclassified Enterococcus TaxID=2608891 RepID=UPI000A33538D|nr:MULTISPECIES: hypothetical protein [unclassified Enterococcus]OTO72855.1 hypothetical protein A5865_001810 [Enterococcus sp. 12E11_DIV0728]OUZ14311.1 hypothetical protein A5868_003334 [Enterococcus sp. 12F9_DIV0723]
MKKFISLVALSSLMFLAVPVGATDIVGEESGEIPINGTLGMDNTDEEAKIVEGEDSWINVTLPTETIFYSTNTKANAPIKSPDYTITNNSGRPVDIKFSKLTKDAGSSTTDVDYDVSLRGFTTNPAIITGGEEVDQSGSPTTIHRLANSKGKLLEGDTDDSSPKTVTYGYEGTVNEDLAATVNHNFDMTLEFESVGW